MIQNIIVIKDGTAIFNENFGECHKLNSDPLLLSAFFDALLSFASEFEQGNLEQIKFKKTNVNYLKIDELLYIAISDISDRIDVIKSKLNKIAKLFTERYHSIIDDYSGEISLFKDFRQILLDKNVAQINCGEHSDCNDCENRIDISSTFAEIVTVEK
ncbi:MAG: hypothetical protein ACTSXA_05920 [Candidatus Heimdallarchaeota archaeon]